jgi:hypothetical protein
MFSYLYSLKFSHLRKIHLFTLSLILGVVACKEKPKSIDKFNPNSSVSVDVTVVEAQKVEKQIDGEKNLYKNPQFVTMNLKKLKQEKEQRDLEQLDDEDISSIVLEDFDEEIFSSLFSSCFDKETFFLCHIFPFSKYI